MKIELFLVGRKQTQNRFEVMGIFDSEETAESHCTSWYDFYGPLWLNEHLGESPREWPGCRYPIPEAYYKEHPDEVPEEARERYAELIREAGEARGASRPQ